MKCHRSWMFLVLCLLICSISTVGLHSATAGAGFSTPQMPRPGDKVKEIAIGAPAPEWRLRTVDGTTIALSELRGKVVVLDFWAEWCKPCRALEPLFDDLVSEYQASPVKFFTMSIWPGRDFNPQAFMKQHKMASTFLIGDNAVARDYGIWGVPTYYVIDGTGKVSYIHVLLSVNSEALGKRLREAIEKALSKDGTPHSASSAVRILPQTGRRNAENT